MAPVTNGLAIFNSIPEGFPVLGETVVYDTSKNIDLDNATLNGGFLVKTLELSIDPYIRGRMRQAHIRSYIDPFHLGEPINGFGVGLVLRSEHTSAKEGDHVYGFLEHVQYQILKDLTIVSILQNSHKLPWSIFVGALGMPGQTAWIGWKEFSKAKKGETVFVSTGAGPVGSFVIQLAKLDGLKVIASASTEEKVRFMKEIGADVAFNYKTTSTKSFWDNVGGETLDAALEAAHNYARFIECGMISGYNSGNVEPVKNLFHVVAKSISMNGFLVTNLLPQYQNDFGREVPGLVANGQIKYREQRWEGLEKVGDAILAVQNGSNLANLVVVHVADD